MLKSNFILPCSLFVVSTSIIAANLPILLPRHDSKCTENFGDNKCTEYLGIAGDMVFLGTYSGESTKSIDIKECTKTGDSQHINSIYFVDDALITHKQINKPHEYTDQVRHQAYSETAPEHMYMLENNHFTYQLCMSSTDEKQSKGQNANIYLFDDQDNYGKYKVNPNQAPDLAIKTIPAIVGGYGNKQCTNVSFKAPRPSYYWITANTPKDINFDYTYYYDDDAIYSPNDYKSNCIATAPGDCPYKLNKEDNVSVLVSVKPNVEMGSSSTHLCVYQD